MDFTLAPEVEDIRLRVRSFVEEHVLPLESDPQNFTEHENIPEAQLAKVREKAKKAGLWAPQSPKEYGGMDLPIAAWAAIYEEAARSVFGPLVFNCMAPDDGNMNLLKLVGTREQKDKWLKPIVEGKVRSTFTMTEPAPGGGSDPSMMRTSAQKKGDRYIIKGRKWFATGADGAAHFILIARTSDDKRRGLTAFLFHKDQPGWRILRRIPIMGPHEHGGHCELEFDGLEIPSENILLNEGDGLKITQIRLGPARLTHCMRWLGFAKRCMEVAQAYVAEREGFGIKLGDRESVQIKLGEVAQQIQIGRLLTMHAAWMLDQGGRARKEVSMAKVQVADTLNMAADVAIQLQGARGYSHDSIAQWIYRYARAARLVDGASEVHMMVLARFMKEEGREFLAVGTGRGAAKRKVNSNRLHDRADLPGHELKFAVAEVFRFGVPARRDLQHLFENFLSLYFDRHSIEDVAAVDIHVVDHAAIHVGIGGKLDRRRWLAAESRAAACGEAHDIAATGDLTGRADRVVSGRVHEHEPFFLHRLGIFVNGTQGGGAAFGCGPQ